MTIRSIMNKKHFYIFVIGLLVVSNFFLLYFLLQKPKGHMPPDGPKNIIIERLNFDDNQIIDYEKLIHQHRKDIRENDLKILGLKNELYLLLMENEVESSIDSLTTEIGKIQKNIEKIHFSHFQDIKALCKQEQIDEFEILSKELAAIFNHKKHLNHPPK